MTKNELTKLLLGYTEELVEATKARDEYQVEYELEKAKLYFTNGVIGLTNQTMRDAQITIIVNENGSYRKMAELITNAKLAWYKWSAIKALVDGKYENIEKN